MKRKTVPPSPLPVALRLLPFTLLLVACGPRGEEAANPRPDAGIDRSPPGAGSREDGARETADDGFRVLATLDIGRNPHQIAFSDDGRTAFVAVAGSDRVAVVDVPGLATRPSLPAAHTPLGVAVLPGGLLAVSRFSGNAVARLEPARGTPVDSVVTGGAPSLLVGPLPDDGPGGRPEGGWLVASEATDRLLLLNHRADSLLAAFGTGSRPFPPAVTSDGRLAFVPGYADGTVTAVDLFNRRVSGRVEVGPRPSGAAVLPSDVEVAVALRGADRVVFLNTVTLRATDTLRTGIGRQPFSVVVSPDGRLAFVNNTASHDVSVIDLERRRVVRRIPVPDVPIVMAVHPSGRSLWVGSEGVHRLTVIRIPRRWREPSAAAIEASRGTTEVAVLGMIHGEHRTSESWGLEEVERALRRLAPDAVCAEIPPDRWERIRRDWWERRALEDERIRVFPEYTDVLLPLSLELGFEIEPCAGWTREMNELRRRRIREFETLPRFAEAREAYRAGRARIAARHALPLDSLDDDPCFLHSPAYDERVREAMGPYDRTLNDWIGPGGWTNINRAHLREVDRALRAHRGERVVITFGSGHKYRFLDSLRRRPDVRLLDVRPFLGCPTAGTGVRRRAPESGPARAR